MYEHKKSFINVSAKFFYILKKNFSNWHEILDQKEELLNILKQMTINKSN